ncbi:MAG: carboxylating nicotinate-nucleotide diphosphorylase [Chlorobi bacterium]|nr:carboxylating nicotinate-nucleotide diphosphorylase [Chlorobiota bacterium]
MKEIPSEQLLSFVDSHVRLALEEDIRSGDLTTWATVDRNLFGIMKIISREGGVAAGVLCAQRTFQLLNPQVKVKVYVSDGERFQKGDVIMEIEGRVRDLLMAERTALNYLQHLSGVATLTRQFVEAVEGTKARITDTRKTIPLWRDLQKWAVRLGGGVNHRYSLSDAVLIKENHIYAAGGIQKAVKKTREFLNSIGKKVPVIVEVENLDQLKQLEQFWGRITRVMLDNFHDVDLIREAVEFVAGRVDVEVSGGVTLENVRDIALAGVDYISIGRLTHSPKAIDFSALLEK